MLDVLERFEPESAGRGHGAFFPDNQPQLPAPGVFEGLGSSAILGPATVCSKGVTLNSWEKGEVPVGVGVEWR